MTDPEITQHNQPLYAKFAQLNVRATAIKEAADIVEDISKNLANDKLSDSNVMSYYRATRSQLFDKLKTIEDQMAKIKQYLVEIEEEPD